MAAFEVFISENARQEFKVLSSTLQERIKKKLGLVCENPLHYFERLKGRSEYKLRVGDYRIIAEINLSGKRIEVGKIGHRSKIYKELN